MLGPAAPLCNGETQRPPGRATAAAWSCIATLSPKLSWPGNAHNYSGAAWCTAAGSDHQCNECKLHHLHSQRTKSRLAKLPFPIPAQVTRKTLWLWLCLSGIFCLIYKTEDTKCVCVCIFVCSYTCLSQFLTAICTDKFCLLLAFQVPSVFQQRTWAARSRGRTAAL